MTNERAKASEEVIVILRKEGDFTFSPSFARRVWDKFVSLFKRTAR